MSIKKILKKIRNRKKIKGIALKDLAILFIAFSFFTAGILIVWTATLKIPDFNSLNQRKSLNSTKIYDRTGEILLYDFHEDVKSTKVSLDQISPDLKNATISIEDAEFYNHFGIRPLSIVRAVLANLTSGGYSQGGSTITQQVVKNALLTPEKKISRKLKEWIVSIKMEKVFTKDEILALYLNESPYGGNIYGVEEACMSFFGKSAKDINLHEAAYIAALPQAPTRFSPYGSHVEELENRKNLVLGRMKELGYITQAELDTAIATPVTFLPRTTHGMKAPHFVTWVREQLVEIYGESSVQENGYRVITTLDYDLQQKAEEIIARNVEENEVKFNAKNAGAVGIDPKTGEVLIMVGSRDYFDVENEGNFNITLSQSRQPGSSFKPFVYAVAFQKGYTPETILFNLRTQFSTTCDAYGNPLDSSSDSSCFMPENYDYKYNGPMSLRNALAQSVNVPAVKLLYLVGIKDSISLAKKMGITSLKNSSEYGLTLVLGSGGVSLLEMTSAYGVFANEGVRVPYQNILRVEDSDGNILKSFSGNGESVLEKNIALQISDILSDNVARTPAFGANSYLYFGGRDVAVKTGTTNDYRDAWIIGYTPSFALGSWAGNNDNSSMEKKVAGFIIAPMWNEIMQEVLKKYPEESFEEPVATGTIKPILRGVWQGGESFTVDKTSGKLATPETPESSKEERYIPNVHSILYWVDKNDPTGSNPSFPSNDPQFMLWETPVLAWAQQNNYGSDSVQEIVPTEYDDVHVTEKSPKVTVVEPARDMVLNSSGQYSIKAMIESTYPITKVDYYINDIFLGSSQKSPFYFSFTLSDFQPLNETNTIKAVVYDSMLNTGENFTTFKFSEPQQN